MIGQVLGHYRVEEKIGVGGMGEVYRAYDQRLERDVAVKVLPAHTLDDQKVRRRFRKEALSLSSLNHPNIATVHDFDSQDGVDFLVMEYVPGTTLSDMLKDGPLPMEQMLDFASQLAAGLAEAHEKDIIHRDIKPANLRVTPDGRLKILDFGLATLVRMTPSEAATMTMTEAGGIIGTIPYMSPEQLRGEAVDARSDIYSTGAVLYEMATGQRRFVESHGAPLIEAILNREPTLPRQLNPHISQDMENVVFKALNRYPEQRYATTRELGEDLSRLQAGVAVAARSASRGLTRRWVLSVVSTVALLAILIALDVGGLRGRWFGGEVVLDTIAVLPIVNLSGDPEEDYLAEGMTRELITELTKIAALKVRPYQSVMRYQKTELTIPEIARELGVDAVVMASVASSGNQLHINAQLIDASENRNVWADSFDRQMQNILGFYGEMARTIAAAVHVVVAPAEAARLTNEKRVDPEAYRLYLLGERSASKLTEEGIRRGIEFCMRAIEIDSTYAPAYATLSKYYFLLTNGAMMHPQEARPLAEAAARKALELDPELGAAHAVSAMVQLSFDWDFDAADAGFRWALALNPGDDRIKEFYGFALVLDGRYDEAIAMVTQLAEADPLWIFPSGFLAYSY